MGLSKRSGSLSMTSSPVENKYVDTSVNIRPSPDKDLSARNYVRDTVSSQSAVNLLKYPDAVNMLKAYIAGPQITVTFYHQYTNTVTDQSNVNDLAIGLDPVHLSYQKICNFVMNVKAQLDFSYINEQNTSRVVGEAIILPGFTPSNGDLFLYEIDRQRMGLFKVNQAPTRLSIKNGTCHSISFELMKVTDAKDIALLEQGVREVSYYNLQRFLTEPGALLKSEEVLILEDIDKIYYILYEYYQATFFDRSIYRSFIRPDKVYDPYIVEFIMKTVDSSISNNYPQQLMSKPLNFHKTIWNKLIMPDAVPWNLYVDTLAVDIYRVSFRTVATNVLVNRQFLICTDTLDQYSFTEAYVLPNLQDLVSEDFDDFTTLLYNYFEHGNINPNLLLNLAEAYLTLTDQEQFYRIPIYMWLLTKIKNSILSGTNDIKYESTIQKPTRYAFTADCSCLSEDGRFLTIPEINNVVLALVDDTGHQYLFVNDDVVYSPSGVVIDLSSVFAAKESNTITGTWAIIFNGGTGTSISLT